MASSLYRELSEKELAEIVSKTLNTEIRSFHLLTGGMFNTTYFVETEKYGRTVLRVGPVNRHLLMPFEHHLMEAQEYVDALCAQHGVPVSKILATDISKTIIDRDFMFVRYIPSKPMNEAQLDEQERTRIVRELGAASAKMHEITGTRFGRIVDVKHGGGFSRWSDALIHELLEWEQVGVPAEFLEAQEYEEVRSLLRGAAPYLDEIKVPHLVHNDLWLGNVLIRTDTPDKEFAAIIDSDRAFWGDPEMEFTAIRWTQSADSFWEGYGRRLSQTPAARIRHSIYFLMTKLWNGYVYLKEYNQPENAWRERQLAREEMALLRRMLYQ